MIIKLGNSMTAEIKVEMFQGYIEGNEMIYQFYCEFMEVSSDTKKENKEEHLGYFRRANRMEVYTKHDRWAKEGWPELTDWSTDDDILFLLDGVGVLICIPKKEAIANNLIEA